MSTLTSPSTPSLLTIQDVSRQTGLSGPTLRYYEDVGLIGPIERDPGSGHRRYRQDDLDAAGALACLRAIGVGIEEMRVYQANRRRGHDAAAEQRDLLLRHADRIHAEIVEQRARLAYLHAKAAVWDARDRRDDAAERAAWTRVNETIGGLGLTR